jgi:hypothetical protein
MKILTTDQPENTPVPKPSNNGSGDLSTLLQEYGAPAETTVDNNTVTKDNGKTEVNNNQNTVQGGSTTNGNLHSNQEWQGNPLYFQTGKKAGQLRPKGPKMVYTPSNTPASISGDLITGAMFLALINLLMPVLISGIHNYFAKKKEDKLKWNDIAITKEQENKLAPIADMAAKQIVLTWSAPAVLIFSMIGLYAMQYALARMENSLKQKSHA